MLAWGKKVSEQFRDRVKSISQELGLEADWLMAVIAFESGGTFSPSVKNKAGSGAVGLIQFMPQTAAALGTTTYDLSLMSGVEQLEFVRRYLHYWSHLVHDLSDLYMSILWPAAIGKPPDYVLFRKSDPLHPARYLQNHGLDWNQDGVITKAEASKPVYQKLEEGRRQENLG